jgi:hypothetical protein
LPACEQTGLDSARSYRPGRRLVREDSWGSAFEDFLTRDFDDGSNIVDNYLKSRAWKERPSTRAYMTALLSSVPNLYEVSDIVNDTSFKAWDLVQGAGLIKKDDKCHKFSSSPGRATLRQPFLSNVVPQGARGFPVCGFFAVSPEISRIPGRAFVDAAFALDEIL